MNQFKIDLHTHSEASPDGGITRAQYKKLIQSRVLDFVAITDHNTTKLAQELHKELGDRIIVGEEIMTTEGEIIGLFLKSTIPAELTPRETIANIKSQNGIVYIPHPLETFRKGLPLTVLEEHKDDIDIIETTNGRAVFQNMSQQVTNWATKHSIPGAASSDAHGISGIGRTHTIISASPSRSNLIQLLRTAEQNTRHPSVRALLYPKYHRLRKKLQRPANV